MSSYALIMLGGTKIQLRESLKYILVNIFSSVMFVASVAYLYAVTGTLNIADLSQRISEVGQGDTLTLISFMFMFVFGIKAALFLYFWLPSSYSAPPTAISAIFAGLLTKVGVYALLRTFTIIFYHQPDVTHHLLAWLGILTMILGVIGALGNHEVQKVLAYSIVYAVGFMVFGLSVLSYTSIQGVIYYLVHDMIIKALLFLLGGTIIYVAGTRRIDRISGLIKRYSSLGWMFFVAILALVGVPPLSGFIGKLLIVKGGLETSNFGSIYFWIALASLITSLLILYSVMKVFMSCFWGEEKQTQLPKKSLKGRYAACAFLLAISVLIGIGAEWLHPFISEASKTLIDPSIYVDAVLKE